MKANLSIRYVQHTTGMQCDHTKTILSTDKQNTHMMLEEKNCS